MPMRDHQVEHGAGQFEPLGITGHQLGVGSADEGGFELIEQPVRPAPAVIAAPPFAVHVFADCIVEPDIVWQDPVVAGGACAGNP